MMGTNRRRGLLIGGGICAILWPVLSTGFYAAYPVAAGGAMRMQAGGWPAHVTRLAELGQRPGVVTLEWANAALPLLLWPFLAALYRLLSQRGRRDLVMVAVGLGFLGMGLMVFSNSFNPTLLHSLAQTYVEAGSEAEGAAMLNLLSGLLTWMRGLNQMSSLLYQGCVGLVSLALILSRTWRARGWVGLAGALLALPAKLSLGWQVPTNAIWTGLAYGIWPVAVGIGLLRYKGSEADQT
jgi:hypothetical protein